jgi:hypothetical protein
MKKIVALLLIVNLMLVFVPYNVWAEQEEVISFQEFYSTLQLEAKKLNMDFVIKDPNYDYVYTRAYLDEQVKAMRQFSEDMRTIKVERRIEPQSVIMRRAMIKSYAFKDTWTASSQAFSVPSYASFTVTAIGEVDLQNGNIVSSTVSTSRKRSVNLDDWSGLQTSATEKGSNLNIIVTGKLEWAWTDPKTNSTWGATTHGPFYMQTIQPEKYV